MDSQDEDQIEIIKQNCSYDEDYVSEEVLIQYRGQLTDLDGSDAVYSSETCESEISDPQSSAKRELGESIYWMTVKCNWLVNRKI